MKLPKKKGAVMFVVALLLLIPAVSDAQLGVAGVVYDPTNYANAVLRYKQLLAQLLQLRQTYQQVLNQYNLALQMSKSVENMPTRYRATFSQWRSFTATNLYGNTAGWVGAVNGGGPQNVPLAYQQATVPLLAYSQSDLESINPADARNIRSAYASLQLADGANVSAMTTVGNVRANSQTVQQQVRNLEQDSFSNDASLNTEVAVLNKINASNVLTLRTLQDANNLRVAALEQQVLQAKQQRDLDAANLNYAIQLRQQATKNLASFNSNLSQTLGAYRLP
jgi:hypothetical protein